MIIWFLHLFSPIDHLTSPRIYLVTLWNGHVPAELLILKYFFLTILLYFYLSRLIYCCTGALTRVKGNENFLHHSLLPVMEKRPRPSLEVAWPLSIVGFEHHTGQMCHLIGSVLSPGAELQHGQQTHQQTTGEHRLTSLTSNTENTENTENTTPLVNFKRKDEACFQPWLYPTSSTAAPREPGASYDCCCGPRDERLIPHGSPE